MCDETWFRLLNARYPTLRYTGGDNASVNRGQMTAAALKKFYVQEALGIGANPNGSSCSSVPAQVSLHRHEEARALLLLRFDEINQAGVADLLADPYAKSTQMVERRLRRAERVDTPRKCPIFMKIKGGHPKLTMCAADR